MRASRHCRATQLPTLAGCFALALLCVSTAQAYYVQQGSKLTATTAVAYQGAKIGVSWDGNTAVVSSPNDPSGDGPAYVYARTNGVWSQSAKLEPTYLLAPYGVTVAISGDGNTIVYGNGNDDDFQGAVWVFKRSGTSWVQTRKLIGIAGGYHPSRGGTVAVSGDGKTILASTSADGAGGAIVWHYDNLESDWLQQGHELAGTGILQERFARSLALSADGNTAIIGEDQNDMIGGAWIFTRSSGVWMRQGPKLVGTGGVVDLTEEHQGMAVAIAADGNTVLVGGGTNNNNQGGGWIFTRSGTTWSQQAMIVGMDNAGAAAQGSSASISADGNTVVLGGPGDAANAGAVWVFGGCGGVWEQRGSKLTGSDHVGPSQQGTDVAASSDGSLVLFSGAYDKNNSGATWAFVCRNQPILDIVGLSAIDVFETTSPVPTQFTFQPNSAVMNSRVGTLNPLNRDFQGVFDEYYDLYYSDADGAPDGLGAFITLECRWEHAAPAGGGLNIAGVRLKLGGGAYEWADVVSSFTTLGDNVIAGSWNAALGPDLTDYSTMGSDVPGSNSRLRLTLGFPTSSCATCATQSDPPRVVPQSSPPGPDYPAWLPADLPILRKPSDGGWSHVDLSVTHTASYDVAIYDIAGRLVRHVYRGMLDPGRKNLTWDGLDEHGLRQQRGAYFLRVSVDGDRRTFGRLLLLLR